MTPRQDLLRELSRDVQRYAGLTDRESVLYDAGKAVTTSAASWRAFWVGMLAGAFVAVVATARWWMA